jgi:hypothetical protein
MDMKSAVAKAKTITNAPLRRRLSTEHQAELEELVDMFLNDELLDISWKVLAEDLSKHWNQRRMQAETLKRNVLRIADERAQSNQRSRKAKNSR